MMTLIQSILKNWESESRSHSTLSFSIELIEALKEKNLHPQKGKKIVFKIENLTKENIDLVMSLSEDFEILVDKDDFKLTKENCSNLLDVSEYLKAKYSKNTYFPLSATGFDKEGHRKIVQEPVWTVEKVLTANAKMENWADTIRNARVDGVELSPFEKYLYAYRIVTEFVFNEENVGEDAKEISRSLVGVLNSGKIVCAGYAELMENLCERIGIECYSQRVSTDGTMLSDHANCCVRIDDEKYGIHGIYYSDPCWDSYNMAENDTENTLENCLLKFDEVGSCFIKYPISITTQGLQKLHKSKVQTFTYQELSEIANLYFSEAENEKLLKSVEAKRAKCGISVKSPEDRLVYWKLDSSRYLSSSDWGRVVHLNDVIFGDPLDVYDIAVEFLKQEVTPISLKNFQKIFENLNDEEIVQAIKVSQICINAGNKALSLRSFQGKSETINLELLEMVKNPSYVSKDNYYSALNNIFLSQGITQEESQKKTSSIWKDTVTVVPMLQSINSPSFSTPFVEEAKEIQKNKAAGNTIR